MLVPNGAPGRDRPASKKLAAAGLFGLGALLVHEVHEHVIAKIFGGGEERAAFVHLGNAFHKVL